MLARDARRFFFNFLFLFGAVLDHTSSSTNANVPVLGSGGLTDISRPNLFLATFRRMPTANAEGWIESEGSVGKVSAKRVFRYHQSGTNPRRSPSACSESMKKTGGGLRGSTNRGSTSRCMRTCMQTCTCALLCEDAVYRHANDRVHRLSGGRAGGRAPPPSRTAAHDGSPDVQLAPSRRRRPDHAHSLALGSARSVRTRARGRACVRARAWACGMRPAPARWRCSASAARQCLSKSLRR